MNFLINAAILFVGNEDQELRLGNFEIFITPSTILKLKFNSKLTNYSRTSCFSVPIGSATANEVIGLRHRKIKYKYKKYSVFEAQRKKKFQESGTISDVTSILR